MKKVDIYTGILCGYCNAAKKILEKKNISFNEIDISSNPDQMEIMLKRSNGAKTVPQIFIGEKHVGGYDELKALENKGELDTLLEN
tara:strand:- start:323 stop:580 length:258 start_codon:yes stop_codon:yes gene_type:complete